MRSSADLMEERRSNIQQQKQSVVEEFSALAASWGGDASSRFQNAMQGFYDECDSILGDLHNLIEDVQAKAHQYDVTHGATADEAASFGKQVGHGPGLRGL
jgi:WXG100 family type VII secretion target